LPIEYGFEPCLLKNAEISLRYHVNRELPYMLVITIAVSTSLNEQ